LADVTKDNGGFGTEVGGKEYKKNDKRGKKERQEDGEFRKRRIKH